MCNIEIRNVAKAKGVPLWKIAQALHVSEPTMTRKMRNELPEKEKVKIIELINELCVTNDGE